VSFSFASCAGDFTVLNGVTFTGLATVNASVSPTQVVIGASGQSSAGTGYALAQVLNAS
jgi:hypothetical protein